MTVRLSRYGSTVLIILAMAAQSSRAELVHFYTFDNDTLDDPTVFDSGNGPPLHGTRTPDLTLTNGRTANALDQALLFEGTSPPDPVYVQLDDYDFTDNFTITAWVAPNPLPKQILTILSNKLGGNVNEGFSFHINEWLGVKLGNLHLEVGNGVSRGDAVTPGNIVTTDGETWQHVALTVDRQNAEARFYYDGEELIDGVRNGIRDDFPTDGPWRIGSFARPERAQLTFHGAMDEVGIWNETLTPEQIENVFNLGAPGYNGDVPGFLQAGDANMDLQFSQLDLVQVQITAKYVTGEAATWGEGDWDGAPGGQLGDPPSGDGFFDQIDIISALAPGHYLTGPYASIRNGGTQRDEQTSLIYDANTGELAVDSPASKDLTSINITSTGSKFVGNKPGVLDGAFDNFAGDNIFKATFGGSFRDITFGNVLPAGLSQTDVAADLSAVGSLAGGGDLGEVDLVYIPEPSTLFLFVLATASMIVAARRNGRSMTREILDR